MELNSYLQASSSPNSKRFVVEDSSKCLAKRFASGLESSPASWRKCVLLAWLPSCLSPPHSSATQRACSIWGSRVNKPAQLPPLSPVAGIHQAFSQSPIIDELKFNAKQHLFGPETSSKKNSKARAKSQTATSTTAAGRRKRIMNQAFGVHAKLEQFTFTPPLPI